MRLPHCDVIQDESIQHREKGLQLSALQSVFLVEPDAEFQSVPTDVCCQGALVERPGGTARCLSESYRILL